MLLSRYSLFKCGVGVTLIAGWSSAASRVSMPCRFSFALGRLDARPCWPVELRDDFFLNPRQSPCSPLRYFSVSPQPFLLWHARTAGTPPVTPFHAHEAAPLFAATGDGVTTSYWLWQWWSAPAGVHSMSWLRRLCRGWLRTFFHRRPPDLAFAEKLSENDWISGSGIDESIGFPGKDDRSSFIEQLRSCYEAQLTTEPHSIYLQARF